MNLLIPFFYTDSARFQPLSKTNLDRCRCTGDAAIVEGMSWLKVAFGVIREAAGTQLGQEVIENIRSSGRNKTPEPAPSPIDVQALLAEHRAQVDRNLETVVVMVNEQNSRLAETIRRQRIWNLTLAAGLVIVLIVVIVAAR